MPGFETSYRDHKGRIQFRAVLKTPDILRNMTPEKKQAWNKATAAIRELMDLYYPDDVVATDKALRESLR